MNITDKSKEILDEYCNIVGQATISVSDYILIRKQAFAELQILENPMVSPAKSNQVITSSEVIKSPTIEKQPEIDKTIVDKSKEKQPIPMRPKRSAASIMRTFDG